MKIKHVLVGILGLTVLSQTVRADTLKLKNGQVVEGKLIGRSDTGIRFQVGNEVHFYTDAEVTSVAIAPGTTTPAAAMGTPAVSTAAAAPTAGAGTTVLAGTTLLVRFVDTVQTAKDAAGKRFTTTLETALQVDGTTVVPAGTKVYGKVLSSSQAGGLAGKSTMSVTLTEITINNALQPIVTETLNLSGESSGKKTVKRGAAGAAIGGAVGGGSGAAKGAAIGAAIGLLGRGSATGIPAGELLEFKVTEPFKVVS